MPKEVVSLSIDRELLDEIAESIERTKQAGSEMDFSKWMRDAVRKKLRRTRRVGEKKIK